MCTNCSCKTVKTHLRYVIAEACAGAGTASYCMQLIMGEWGSGSGTELFELGNGGLSDPTSKRNHFKPFIYAFGLNLGLKKNQRWDQTKSVQFWFVWPHLLHKGNPLKEQHLFFLLLKTRSGGPTNTVYAISAAVTLCTPGLNLK